MQIDRPIAIAITLFIILLLVFFLAAPEYNTFIRLRTDLAQRTAEYNAEHEYYSAIDRIYFDLQNKQDDLRKIDDALPSGSDLGELVYFFQQTAKENGLIAKNLFLSKTSSNIADTNAKGSVKDIVFSIDLSGDYPSLEGFIASLERSSRIFEITSISFGSASGSLYTFNLQVKTHSY